MLRKARNATGLSREEAAHRLFVGGRTLASYELGETIAPPDVVMKMSEVYQEPTLPADYCAKVCPIGQVLAHCLQRSESDGRVNPHEVEDFKTIIKELIELERQIGELKFFALRQGIEIGEIMPVAG